MQEEAFLVAESLITTYKQENQSLKEQVQSLQNQLEHQEQRLLAAEDQQNTIQHLEKSILKYSERVNELLELNLVYEHKVRTLEREI